MPCAFTDYTSTLVSHLTNIQFDGNIDMCVPCVCLIPLHEAHDKMISSKDSVSLWSVYNSHIILATSALCHVCVPYHITTRFTWSTQYLHVPCNLEQIRSNACRSDLNPAAVLYKNALKVVCKRWKRSEGKQLPWYDKDPKDKRNI